ncbi:N-acetyl-lysine deacetylase, partial [Acidianus sp. RZ1]
KILFVSHIDTVQGFIEPKVEKDVIYGRGAVDDKGPLIAMLLSTWLLHENGYDVMFAALSDEENKSAGARELLNSGNTFENIIVGEPTNGNIVIEYRGVIHLDIECKGKGEHSSSSSENLIVELGEKIRRVYLPPSSYDKPSIVPTIIRSGDRLNVTPSDGYVHFDIRYPSTVNEKAIISEIVNVFVDCEFKVVESVPPVKVQPNNPLVISLFRALSREGIKPSLSRKAGTSDMNILFPIAKNIVAFGPGDSKLEHTDKEKISLEEIYKGIRVYTNTIEELCKEN